MPMYAYKGVATSGKAISGVRDAESPKVLRQLLRKDGVHITSFDLSKGGQAAKRENAKKSGLSRDVDLGGLFGGVKKALVEQVNNVRFKAPLSEVRGAVNEGSSFADALARHPKLFDELFVSMVRAGEIAGNLDEVLTRLADFLEGSQKLKAKVQSAMIYP
ncbi:MAG: type II secretion system protein GspF, partial [Deltaproteobacteria bacterium]